MKGEPEDDNEGGEEEMKEKGGIKVDEAVKGEEEVLKDDQYQEEQ